MQVADIGPEEKFSLPQKSFTPRCNNKALKNRIDIKLGSQTIYIINRRNFLIDHRLFISLLLKTVNIAFADVRI